MPSGVPRSSGSFSRGFLPTSTMRSRSHFLEDRAYGEIASDLRCSAGRRPAACLPRAQGPSNRTGQGAIMSAPDNAAARQPILPELERLLIRAARRQAAPRFGRRRWALAAAAAALVLAGGAVAATGVFRIADGDTSKGVFTIESRPVPAAGRGEPSRGSVCLQFDLRPEWHFSWLRGQADDREAIWAARRRFRCRISGRPFSQNE